MKILFDKIPAKGIGILALLGAVLFWGPAPVITKLTLEEVPEISLGFLRHVIAVALLFLLFFRKGAFAVRKKDIPLFVLAGLLGSALNALLFLFGIKFTSAISAQTIFTATPILTALFAYFILKERITFFQFTGVAIGLAGAVLIAARDVFETGTLSLGSLQGNALIFLAVVSWVLYILVSKRLSATYSPVTITSCSFLVGFIVFTPLFFAENFLKGFDWMFSLSPVAVFGIFYQGVFAAVAAVLLYQIGLRLTSAFTAGVILYLNSVVTPFFAVPILGEKITLPFVAGAVLIVTGSFLAAQLELLKNHIVSRRTVQKAVENSEG